MLRAAAKITFDENTQQLANDQGDSAYSTVLYDA